MITRSSNNYGPYQFPEKLIPLMILNILQCKPLPVYGTGENVRDWIYVGDNCRAIAEVVERGQVGQVYNVGSGQECRNIDLVRLLCRVMATRLGRTAAELEASITFVEDRPGHDWRYALDTSKIRNELGFTPEVSLASGLERTVDWYLANRSWLRHAAARADGQR
jgi:dTDP-glucose 4,6-dehydratase